MTSTSPSQSVVTRLVASLLIGGLLISIGLSAIELWRHEAELQNQITGKVAVSVRNLQSVLRGVLVGGTDRDVQNVLGFFLGSSPIRAMRIEAPGRSVITVGQWPTQVRDPALWPLAEEAMTTGQEIDLDRTTIIRAPFNHRQFGTVSLELLVDGPTVRAQQRAASMRNLAVLWMFLAVMTLIGLMLVRQWFTGPLGEVVRLTSVGIGPEPFFRLSSQMRGEFAQLCQSIGGMLQRLEITTQELKLHERAMADLYQLAPAAMLGLDTQGRILQGNQRAADLLEVRRPTDLIGRDVLAMVRAEDRPLLHQSIERLDIETQGRCEVRIDLAHRTCEVAVECSAQRDAEGKVANVRLSLLDVTAANAMRRDLENKGRLLNLVLDHMSEAILLVDGQGQIAAVNQQLAALLKTRTELLMGQRYDVTRFWEPMGLSKFETAIEQLQQIESDATRPAQSRVETRDGVFVFESLPVHEGAGKPVGRLWVVRETTAQEQNRLLLEQQSSQLQAMSQLSQQIADVRSVDELLTRASDLMHEILGVEAVGLALRSSESGTRAADGSAMGRSKQMLHRGHGPYLLEANRGVIAAIEQHLMPQTLSAEQAVLWQELPTHAPWAKAMAQAGLTCLAATPLRGAGKMRGMLWIARRGGQRIERQHTTWLQTLAPMIAAAVEVAQLRQDLSSLELTDALTDLPNRRHFDLAVRRLVNRPGRTWSTVIFNIDHFRQLNDRVGHDQADALLTQIAQTLQRSVRPSTFVARLGGNTFGLLAPEADLRQAEGLAIRLQRVLNDQPLVLENAGDWTLSVSMGVASSPEDGCLGTGIIDLAMGRVELARQAGRGCIVTQGSTPVRLVG